MHYWVLIFGLLSSAPEYQVIETAPLESELDLREVANARDVLPGLFAQAESSIAIATMYLLWYPAESRGRQLFVLYDELIAAARRGVKVRILLDSTTLEANRTPTYQRMRESLNQIPGITVRALDLRPYSRYAGCLLHAKYIVIDNRIAVIGSHNWSYGAFADNRELSLLIRDTAVTRQLSQLFEQDWQLAATHQAEPLQPTAGAAGAELVVTAPSGLSAVPLLSTREALARLCSSAQKGLVIEVNSLTSRADFGSESEFRWTESLLTATADRGVRIRLLVDKWAYEQEPELLRRLNRQPNLAVRVIDIAPSGPNPRTGTVHCKLVIADERRALLTSATLSQRQLLECRNVGVMIEQPGVVRQLQQIFDTDWSSPYTFRP